MLDNPQDDFAGITPFMVHEMRTSLQIMKGFMELYKSDGDMEHCDKVQYEMIRMDDMLK